MWHFRFWRTRTPQRVASVAAQHGLRLPAGWFDGHCDGCGYIGHTRRDCPDGEPKKVPKLRAPKWAGRDPAEDPVRGTRSLLPRLTDRPRYEAALSERLSSSMVMVDGGSPDKEMVDGLVAHVTSVMQEVQQSEGLTFSDLNGNVY